MQINGKDDGLFVKSLNTGCLLILGAIGLSTASVILFVLLAVLGSHFS